MYLHIVPHIYYLTLYIGVKSSSVIPQAQRQAAKEVAKYKRRSIDIERQLLEYQGSQRQDAATLAAVAEKAQALRELEQDIERRRETLEDARDKVTMVTKKLGRMNFKIPAKTKSGRFSVGWGGGGLLTSFQMLPL